MAQRHLPTPAGERGVLIVEMLMGVAVGTLVVAAALAAWAIQALFSAGERPGKAPFRFLSRLRRGDGSYRYSVQYGTTPVWVTAQVIPALAGRSFPLR